MRDISRPSGYSPPCPVLALCGRWFATVAESVIIKAHGAERFLAANRPTILTDRCSAIAAFSNSVSSASNGEHALHDLNLAGLHCALRSNNFLLVQFYENRQLHSRLYKWVQLRYANYALVSDLPTNHQQGCKSPNTVDGCADPEGWVTAGEQVYWCGFHNAISPHHRRICFRALSDKCAESWSEVRDTPLGDNFFPGQRRNLRMLILLQQ